MSSAAGRAGAGRPAPSASASSTNSLSSPASAGERASVRPIASACGRLASTSRTPALRTIASSVAAQRPGRGNCAGIAITRADRQPQNAARKSGPGANSSIAMRGASGARAKRLSSAAAIACARCTRLA
ncbi:Uncharacterised protein [Burkholderia pseudomallei]|nr:Uncharacterised protein [Burkholderia pseudomallei]